jgi:formyl-CoA transferase
VGNDRQWQRLCAIAGWEDLAADPRFGSNPQRVENRATLVPILQERFRQHPAEEWRAMLLQVGIPCAPINAIDQVFADPQVLARGMSVELPHPTAGAVKMAGSPFKLSRTPVRLDRAPPLLGQHTDEILHTHLGYDDEEIARLRAEGVI